MAELDEQEQEALRDEEIKYVTDNLGDEELEKFFPSLISRNLQNKS
jgi:hypothetical protein